MAIVAVSGSFDDLRSPHIRFLQEAAKLGELHVQLWSDGLVQKLEGHAPKFPQAERLYFVQAMRYVTKVTLVADAPSRDVLAELETASPRPDIWAVTSAQNNPAKRHFAAAHRLTFQLITEEQLQGFPLPPISTEPSGKPRVIVTGCFDWVHTGHVRFFEEASAYGDLYVVPGHDQNIELLKGKGRPLFPGAERKYIVQSIRYVKQALISSGNGWLDAEPEMQVIKPDIYLVNEDGDRPEKKEYCEKHGIQYLVLKRLPKEGLTRRSSTDLRGY